MYYILTKDHLATLLPSTTKLTGFPDAGYFADLPNTKGDYVYRGYFQVHLLALLCTIDMIIKLFELSAMSLLFLFSVSVPVCVSVSVYVRDFILFLFFLFFLLLGRRSYLELYRWKRHKPRMSGSKPTERAGATVLFCTDIDINFNANHSLEVSHGAICHTVPENAAVCDERRYRRLPGSSNRMLRWREEHLT